MTPPADRRFTKDTPDQPAIVDLVRRRIAVLITAFALPGALLILGSPAGPPPGAPRIAAIGILLSTVPVSLIVYRTRTAFLWFNRPSRQAGLALAFTVYADVGTAGFLLLFRDQGTALFGCALFAVVSSFVAFFGTSIAVVFHVVATTAVILIVTLRAALDPSADTLALAAAGVSLWLAVNGTMTVISQTSATLHSNLRTQIGRAQTDPLTGLLNLRGLEQMVLRRVDDDVTLGFLLVDLDHFKRVNDLHGHLVGDDVLALAASRLATFVGDDGLVARRGGEEFLVVITADVDEGELIDRAESARHRLHVPADAVPITASVGASLVTPDDIADQDVRSTIRLGMHRADIAMYRAKSAGRDNVQFHGSRRG
ncbi:GGDEF domain-containing protein [Rhodococcoides corynebacterioides]|uniref:GGDEF domain-containing protein n=1 Tax=Rhodococcoides corynebacterioides TaxID=53972 RepID=UPI001C9B7B9C|nr:GGDEF domain-containing protein [Rhodococcus corynebacterioides]MBY6349095.1 GGDEF domain-containing protein [Rhodococcus corynebacterioides]